jgi:hypothetical protein
MATRRVVIGIGRRSLLGIVVAGCVALAVFLAAPRAAASCDGAAAGTCTRVLFIGNSYTSVNDLPGTFAALARSGGHAAGVAMIAPGGAYLADEVGSAAVTSTLLPGRWDVVVLQEQSELPASPGPRGSRMAPAVQALAQTARSAGAMPLLFMTPAHRDGWPDGGLAGYAAMQRAIDDGYLSLAGPLAVPVAPVGWAWWTVHAARPSIDLWAADGSHPSAAGTYLAACVFYAAIFRGSPVGLAAADGVPGDVALALQRVAATVLDDPARWGLR